MEYLDSLNTYGSVPGLDSVRRLLDMAGNPQNAAGFIHIAGTNGKGSVGTFISNILVKAGLRVGRFLSPAVTGPCEIIKFNNIDIPSDTLEKYIDLVKPLCEQITVKGYPHPTRFEVETAIAFMYFRDMCCDISVIECGMGGLLDATNVIENTLLSVITPIGMDHMGFLGNTIEEIAAAKAGIIKDNRPVLAYYDERYCDVIAEKARIHNSPVFWTHPDNCVLLDTDESGRTSFDYGGLVNIKPGMSGLYQAYNAAMAVDAVNVLRLKGYDIADSDVYEGISNSSWFGRFQYLSHNPDFIIDGAHNPHAAKALTASLKNIYRDGKVIIIIGVFADKDYGGILQSLSLVAKEFITMSTPGNPRALSAKKLADYIKTYYDIPVACADNIDDAVSKALAASCGRIPIVACGSLSHLKMLEDCYNGYR